MSSITDTDFKMTTEKKILKKKTRIVKKKTHIVKKKKDIIKDKFDDINSTNIINKTEQNETMTMTEQQKQTEISRRVKNYWLREKKNKLICLIGIGQTLKEEEEEKKKEQVGDMKCVVRRISRFRPNPFPEIDALGEAWRGWCAGLPSHNRRLHPSPSLHPSKIIHARLEDWTHKNKDKIKKKMMKSFRLSTSINHDNSITARLHANSMSFKNPLKKEFKKCEIVFDKNLLSGDDITYYDVLDWKSSVFSTLKYARHFCELRRYDPSIRHHRYAKLYKGCVNKKTLVEYPHSPTFGKWFNPSKYATSYGDRSCRQVFPADLINDEASYNRELSKITDGKTIDGEVIHDFVPHIEISHNWEKTSKWSSLKWKIVSTFNLIPKMCAKLNISITTFKKLYLLMLKDLKKRTFTADPYTTKKKSLWALFYNKWNKNCDFEKIIYAFSEGLYLSDASSLRRFCLPATSRSTQHLNLTFKNEVAGTEYEIDFTDLIVMAMMIGSNGSTEGSCSSSLYAGGFYTGRPLFMYARKWDMSPSSIKRTSSYLINSKLYPELCILKSDTTAISPYY